MDPIWDPERLRVVGSVLSRYGAHLAEGDRVRLGMEGDPCAVYRAAEEAPRATVVEVTRGADGDVRFRARLDGSDEIVERDNRTVAPDRLWEVDPDYLETFRAHVARAEEESHEPPHGEAAPHHHHHPAHDRNGDSPQVVYAGAPDESEYRSTVQDRFERLAQQFEEMDAANRTFRATMDENEAANRTFRETMGLTVRALAGDLMRTSRGTPIEFAHQYADRYDLAVAERVSGDIADDYRGDGSGRRRRSRGVAAAVSPPLHQDEKYNFKGGDGTIEESSQLSDDEA
tara:strand:- start:834 stop:1694 length:861 start_codon:yes stop_codon:yes gene_type:complete